MYLKGFNFINKYTGQYKTVPVGFSWGTLFFGFFLDIFRKEWKWAIIQFCLACITLGGSWLVMPFIYNKLYIKDLLSKDFIPVDEDQANYLFYKGIIGRLEKEFFNKMRYEILK